MECAGGLQLPDGWTRGHDWFVWGGDWADRQAGSFLFFFVMVWVKVERITTGSSNNRSGKVAREVVEVRINNTKSRLYQVLYDRTRRGR